MFRYTRGHSHRHSLKHRDAHLQTHTQTHTCTPGRLVLGGMMPVSLFASCMQYYKFVVVFGGIPQYLVEKNSSRNMVWVNSFCVITQGIQNHMMLNHKSAQKQ